MNQQIPTAVERVCIRKLKQDIQDCGVDGGMATSEAIETYENYMDTLVAKYRDHLLNEWAKQELEERMEEPKSSYIPPHPVAMTLSGLA